MLRLETTRTRDGVGLGVGGRREDNSIVGHLKRSSSIRVKIEGQKEAASLGEKDRDRAA